MDAKEIAKKVGKGLGDAVLTSLETSARDHARNPKCSENKEAYQECERFFHDTRKKYFSNNEDEDY